MKVQTQTAEPGEIEALLPWHAAGTLNACEARRVDAALARNPDLEREYVFIQEECAGIVLLNEGLGAPSLRAMYSLFAAIDAEPPGDGLAVAASKGSARVADLSAWLSPGGNTRKSVLYGPVGRAAPARHGCAGSAKAGLASALRRSRN